MLASATKLEGFNMGSVRTFLLVLLLTFATPAFAGAKEDALAVLEKWSQAFAASDVDTIVETYAADALFMGTGSKTVVTDRADIRKYFEATLLANRPRGAPITSSQTMVLSDEVVLITGHNASTGVRDGVPFSNPGRVTFVIAKRAEEWKIVHFHRSPMPK
jgi:uncharacterized protein (TIGR02246 family)